MKTRFDRPSLCFALCVGILVAVGAGFLHTGGRGRLYELIAVGAGVLVGYLAGAPLSAIAGVAAAGSFVVLEAYYTRFDRHHAVASGLYAVGAAAAGVLAGFVRRPPSAPGERSGRGTDPLQVRPAPGSVDYELQRSLRHNHLFSVLVVRPDDLEERARYGPYGMERIADRVATVIGEHLRASDVARRRGEHDFWVILPETTGPASRVVAERIRLALGAREIELAPGKTTRLSVSVGISSFPEDGATGPHLVAAAERALRGALQQGGNRTLLATVPSGAPAGWGLPNGSHAKAKAPR